MTGDIKGSLGNGDDRLLINGGIVGNFRSDGEINAAGLTGRDTSDTDFILNGVAQDGDLGIVAIRQRPGRHLLSPRGDLSRKPLRCFAGSC